MEYLEIVLLAIGAVLLIAGYRKNRRNVLLLGAIVLFLSAATDDFTHGFAQGWRQGTTSARSAIAGQVSENSSKPAR